MKQKIVYSLSELPAVVASLKKAMSQEGVITLSGPLGAGKTTLVQEWLKSMGVQQPITSPTFTYMNQYESKEGIPLYHFDLYRIKDKQQFIDAGFQEYLHQPDGVTLIEWPETIESLLPQMVVKVTISYHEDPHKRLLEVIAPEGKNV